MGRIKIHYRQGFSIGGKPLKGGLKSNRKHKPQFRRPFDEAISRPWKPVRQKHRPVVDVRTLSPFSMAKFCENMFAEVKVRVPRDEAALTRLLEENFDFVESRRVERGEPACMTPVAVPRAVVELLMARM